MQFYFKILFSFCLLLNSSDAVPDNMWLRQSSPVTAPLFNCTFTDTLNGWAAGDSGIIIHTSDGGSNWIIQNNPVNYYINDIFFINKRLGWAVSNEYANEGTTILKTTNGGNNWTAEPFQDSIKIFRTVYFLDSLTGYLGGYEGTIFKTTDAGNSWNEMMDDSTKFTFAPITKFCFVSKEVGFACGGQMDVAGVIWRTTNSGMFWVADYYAPEPFYDIYIKDPLNLISVGGDFEYGAQLTKTSDAGINWNYESLQMFGQGQSLDFRTAAEGWMALGFSQTWAVTYDSGISWSSVPTINNSTIYSVVFADSLHGWAVGYEGRILKYNPQTVGIINLNSRIPVSVILNQNHPNPFNPKTIISYELPVANHVSLRVYDALGKFVATLVNEKQNAGRYNYQLSTINYQLSSGIYFYKLTAGKFSETKRMVLLK